MHKVGRFDANRRFLKMVNDTGKLGRVAFKPTQAMEDGINAGILSWMLQGTKFNVGRKYAVDGYVEHRELVDRIIALLPADFKDGMENWTGQVEQHIADTNYGLLLWDLIEKQDVIVLATDLDGDRLTDLLADVSDPLRAFGQRVADLDRPVCAHEPVGELAGDRFMNQQPARRRAPLPARADRTKHGAARDQFQVRVGLDDEGTIPMIA